MGIVRKALRKSIVWHSNWQGNIQSKAEQEGQIHRIPGIPFAVSHATRCA